jgi:DNA polymerase-3 subunit gamma/tau
MAYQVTARKWRPQKFEEVVFQEHISKTIKNSLIQGRVSHAYIFSGPRGVGKTTMARIVAKALNCQSGDGPVDNPCGKCENCVEIKNGSAFDVIEIDGASNRGIENIRELRENVNLAPVKSRYKVYIIDEVHMLTKEAFNALLKTLEEPPPHIVFIFATTEIHRIPETILSRCQKYQFKKIPVEVVVNHLKSIVDKEGFKLKKDALYPIARAGEGNLFLRRGHN